jgi:hypothetical protein
MSDDFEEMPHTLEQEEDTTQLVHEEAELEFLHTQEESGGASSSGGNDGSAGTDAGSAESAVDSSTVDSSGDDTNLAPSSGQPAGPIVVVDSDGQVVGTAHVNPETGTVDLDQEETTVVVENPPPGTTGGAGEPGGTDIASGPGGGATPASSGVPFFIDPDTFNFHPIPKNNRQSTDCVPIVFKYGSAFLAPLEIVVRVRVEANIVQRNGKVLTVAQAKRDSANGAFKAAALVISALDDVAISPSEIPDAFAGFMARILAADQGKGYEVTRC